MRTRIYGVTAVLALAVSTVGASTVAPGNLVVLESLGDTAAGSQVAVPLSLIEYTKAASAAAVQTVNIPTSGAARLTLGGLTATEGVLTYNDGYLGIAGYDADPGTAAVFSTATNALRRMVGYDVKQDLAAGPQFNATTTAFVNANIRSAIYSTTAGGAYGIGTNAVVYQPNGGSGAGVVVANPPGNTLGQGLQGIGIFGGNTYVYGAMQTHGIYKITGTPITTGNVETSFVPTPAAANGGKAVTGYNFWISPDLNTAYLAEDNDTNTGGIKKYINTAGTWSLAYTISTDYDGAGTAITGAKSVTVDNSGVNPILYVTTSDRATLLSITDTGSAAGAQSTLSILQTVPAGNAFRSVVFIPHVPGDTNDSGAVNGDDYTLIDKGYARYNAGMIPAGTAVWLDGDYNHDGSVNAADYLIIDRAYASATGQLDPALLDQRLTQFGQGYVDSLIASVPEPTTALLAIPAVALFRRRRQA